MGATDQSRGNTSSSSWSVGRIKEAIAIQEPVLAGTAEVLDERGLDRVAVPAVVPLNAAA